MSPSRHQRAPALWLAYLPLAPVLCLPAAARGAEPDPAIVVTGERQARTVAQTPSSVAVVTSEDIARAAGAARLEDILAAVPNVQLGSGAEGPTIRGQDGNGPLRDLPAFLSGNRPRVAVQIDGRAIGYSEIAYGVANVWDVDRIEVYRSPQSTTQGRNAIAGAIFAYTKDPTFAWEGRVRALVGAADTAQVSGAVSGPLVGETIAFRASADVRRSRPASRITAPGADVDYNRDRYKVYRLKLLAAPPGAPGVRVTATVNHNRSSAPQFEGARAPFEARRDPEATYGFFDVRVDSAALQGDWQLSPGLSARVTATTGDAAVRRHAPPGFGVTSVDGRDYSIEPILTWRSAPALALIMGANWSRARLEQRIDLTAAGFGKGEFHDLQESLGLFGQAEWEATDALTLAAGARYQRDDQQRNGVLGLAARAPQTLDYRRRFERLLGKFSVTWMLSPQLRIGALAQQAYNPGGVSLDARRRVVQTFGAETLWNYEVFLRAGDPSTRFAVSANAFYYDIDNPQRSLQRQIPTPAGIVTISEIGNAEAGVSYGAEIEGRWRPTRRLAIAAGAGVLHTRLTSAAAAADPLNGKAFQLSPRFTASLAADWRPLDGLELSLRGRRHSGYFSDDINDPARRVSGASIVDASARWTAGDLTLAAYARNLFDTFYLTYHSGPGSRLATAGDPRELGVSAEVRF